MCQFCAVLHRDVRSHYYIHTVQSKLRVVNYAHNIAQRDSQPERLSVAAVAFRVVAWKSEKAARLFNYMHINTHIYIFYISTTRLYRCSVQRGSVELRAAVVRSLHVTRIYLLGTQCPLATLRNDAQTKRTKRHSRNVFINRIFMIYKYAMGVLRACRVCRISGCIVWQTAVGKPPASLMRNIHMHSIALEFAFAKCMDMKITIIQKYVLLFFLHILHKILFLKLITFTVQTLHYFFTHIWYHPHTNSHMTPKWVKTNKPPPPAPPHMFALLCTPRCKNNNAAATHSRKQQKRSHMMLDKFVVYAVFMQQSSAHATTSKQTATYNAYML